MATAVSLLHHKSAVSLLHAFGISKTLSDNIIFLDNDRLVFPVGRHYAIYRVSNRSMSFILESEKVKVITPTAMTVSPDRKYLGVCEIAEDDITNLNFVAMTTGGNLMSPQPPSPQISIYSFTTQKKVRTLTRPPDVSDNSFQCIAFSHDSKHCAAVCAGPDYSLILWHWNQPLRILGVAKQTTPATHISFHPLDNSQLCLSGPKTLKVFRFVDGVLKQYNLISGRRDPPTFTAHLWVPETDRILAATEKGDLCLFDRGELHLTLTSVLGSGIGITGLVSLNKGSIAVVGEKGKVAIFDAAPEESEAYRLRFAFDLPSINKPFGTATFAGSDRQQRDAPSMLMELGRDYKDNRVTAVTASPNSQLLACVISNSQICLANLPLAEATAGKERDKERETEKELDKDSSADRDKEREKERERERELSNVFEFVGNGFHNGSITDLSVAFRKPLLATCGTDQYVRIWNYIDMTCELAMKFDTETRSISLHPSGFHLVLSCGDRVKLMNIMATTLDCLKEFPFPQQSGCQRVLFSHGGQFFACAHAKTISLYDTFSCECIGVMRGHIAPVKSVCFSANDEAFFSCGMDGAVYEWNLDFASSSSSSGSSSSASASASGSTSLGTSSSSSSSEAVKRENENIVQGCSYTSIVSGEKKTVAVVGSDLHLRQITGGAIVTEFQTSGISKRLTHLAIIGTVGGTQPSPSSGAVSHIVGGMASGGLRVYAWPLSDTFGKEAAAVPSASAVPPSTPSPSSSSLTTASALSPNSAPSPSSSVTMPAALAMFDEYLGHSMSVSGIAVNFDSSILFTASEDGSLFMWGIQAVEGGKLKPFRLPELNLFWDAKIISRQELEEQQMKVASLQNKIKELNFQSESMLAKKEKRFQEKMEGERKQFEEELKQKLEQIDHLEATVTESKNTFDEKVAELEQQHLQAMDDLERVYEQDVQMRQQSIKQLQQEKEDLQVKYEEMIGAMQTQFSWKEDKIKEHYVSIDQQNSKAFEGLKEEMKLLADRYEQKLREQEDESEAEISQLKVLHQDEMDRERKRLREMDEEILTCQTKLRVAMDSVEPLKQEKNELERRYMEAKATVEQLRNDLRNHDIRMSEHEDTIADKDAMIMRLKKENQELDKFKFVLDFKIKELEKTIQPKNEQIRSLEDQIQEMDAELEREHRRSVSTQLELKEKMMRMIGLREENKDLKSKAAKQSHFIELFRHDLHELVQSEEATWKEKVKKLYLKFVKAQDDRTTTKEEGDEQRAQEFARQREFLERSVTTLKQSLDRYKSRGKGEVQQKLDENIKLIEEINDLRKEKRELLLKIQDLRNEVLSLKQNHGNATLGCQGDGGELGDGEPGADDVDVFLSPSLRHRRGATSPLGTTSSSGVSDSFLSSTRQTRKGGVLSRASGGGRDGARSTSPQLKGHLYLSGKPDLAELTEGKTKVAELLKLLEANTEEMKQQQEELNLLRSFVEDLIQRFGGGTEGNQDSSSFSTSSSSTFDASSATPSNSKAQELSSLTKTAKELLTHTESPTFSPTIHSTPYSSASGYPGKGSGSASSVTRFRSQSSLGRISGASDTSSLQTRKNGLRSQSSMSTASPLHSTHSLLSAAYKSPSSQHKTPPRLQSLTTTPASMASPSTPSTTSLPSTSITHGVSPPQSTDALPASPSAAAAFPSSTAPDSSLS